MGRPGAQVTLLRLHLHPTPQPGRQDHSFSSCQTHQSQTPTCFHGNEAATPSLCPWPRAQGPVPSRAWVCLLTSLGSALGKHLPHTEALAASGYWGPGAWRVRVSPAAGSRKAGMASRATLLSWGFAPLGERAEEHQGPDARVNAGPLPRKERCGLCRSREVAGRTSWQCLLGPQSTVLPPASQPHSRPGRGCR